MNYMQCEKCGRDGISPMGRLLRFFKTIENKMVCEFCLAFKDLGISDDLARAAAKRD